MLNPLKKHDAFGVVVDFTGKLGSLPLVNRCVYRPFADQRDMGRLACKWEGSVTVNPYITYIGSFCNCQPSLTSVGSVTVTSRFHL